MKPINFKIPKASSKALMVQVDKGPHFYDHLHFHPEGQVTLIVQGEGLLYAGNGMVSFGPGDVFILGSNLPHLLKNNPLYFQSNSPEVHSISLFYSTDLLGDQFLNIAEMKKIKKLLLAAQRGIKIDQQNSISLVPLMTELKNHKNHLLLVQFLKILSACLTLHHSYVGSETGLIMPSTKESSRLNEVLNYIFDHYQKNIKIDQVAKVSHLSKSQFSYFFKLHTGKTFVDFLNEVRIEKACQLLQKEDLPVEQICYEVGFNNLSNFSRQFKKRNQMTPSKFRKLWQL